MRYYYDVYITLEWQEQGPMDVNGRRLQRKERIVCDREYPKTLSCHNPNCEDGGFEIGDRIAKLLASGNFYEQNSLVCNNAIHPDRNKRCMHTIGYSISCIYPHGRGESRSTVHDLKLG